MLIYQFEYTNQMNTILGNKIVDHEDNLEFIEKLLKTSKLNPSLPYSWSSFDWVDNQNLQRVNSQLGIRDPAPDMSAREYTYLSPKHPWTLQFAKPTLGNPSKKLVIPAGTGITNADGKYLGVVVIGFVVEDLIKQIEQFTNNHKLGFLLEGVDGIQYLKYGNDTEYLTENKLGNYPFMLKVGFKRWSMQKEFLQNLWHDILKMTFGMVFLTGLLIIIRKALKKKTLQSDKRSESLLHLSQYSKEEINVIKQQINDTITQVNNNMTQKEKERELTDPEKQEMYSVVITLRMLYSKLFSPSSLYLKPSKLQDILSSVLHIYANEIQIVNLKVETVFNFDEPIIVDEIKMKKVLAFLILYISDVVRENTNLTITFSKEEQSIKILFAYKHIIESNIENYAIDSDTNYDYVESVVRAHKGELMFQKSEIVLIISSILEE